MKEYQLYEQDFLAFQLFTYSQKQYKKKLYKSWFWLVLAFVVCSLFLFLTVGINTISLIYMGLLLIFAVIYPKYFKYKIEKHFLKYIRSNYQERIGQNCSIMVNELNLYLKDFVGEGTVKLSEIKHIDELPAHLFIQVSNGTTLIVPKENFKEYDELKQEFKDLGVNFKDHTKWTW